ncbi:MAG: bifunctional UDP-4-keto-pentose/UDP-xylose synthase [Gammaproteobacteria bacterium]
MTLKVLILGANGFIGHTLVRAILEHTDWEIFGLDLSSHQLADYLNHPRLHFMEGDMTIQKEWIAYHIEKCQVVLPLVAIATPATYVKDPLKIFELDFEANLEIIRQCLKYNARVIFPSTSEVYGMCQDAEFHEAHSNFVVGPIHKERWIYSTSKQLLDRVIYAYGKHQGLAFTLFRPFNWIGPGQDNIFIPHAGSSRVVTQFLSNIVHGQNIQLVDGGKQQRSFTYIDDGIDCLLKIIANQNDCATGEIFNIGNPSNNVSIRELAELMLSLAQEYPFFAKSAANIEIVSVPGETYYGAGYQDVSARVPSIANADKRLGWKPTTDLETAIRKTLASYT